MPCDDAADCAAEGSPAGYVCCVTEDPNTGLAASVGCVAPADCTTGNGQTVMCDDGDPCPANETCGTSTTTIPGYKICKQ